MNFTALDIIHFWTDSRGKQIQKIYPTRGKVSVYCTDDLSSEAAKVCNFLNLIVKQPWTFQTNMENDKFVITFFPETVTLENLFRTQFPGRSKKNPRAKREDAGVDSNL